MYGSLQRRRERLKGVFIRAKSRTQEAYKKIRRLWDAGKCPKMDSRMVKG